MLINVFSYWGLHTSAAGWSAIIGAIFPLWIVL